MVLKNLILVLLVILVSSCGDVNNLHRNDTVISETRSSDTATFPTLGDTVLNPMPNQKVSNTVDFQFNPIVPKINAIYVIVAGTRQRNLLEGSQGVDLYTQGFCHRFSKKGKVNLDVVSNDVFGRPNSFKTSFEITDLNGKSANCPDKTGGQIYKIDGSGVVWTSIQMPSPYDPVTPYPHIPTGICKMKKETIRLHKHGNVKFPAQGRAVREAHYVTRKDPRGYPSTTRENINIHLDYSCSYLINKYPTIFGSLSEDCSEIYDRPGAHSWTPAEHGKIGQGSRGWVKPGIVEELWNATMYWGPGERPVAGSKFIVMNKNNGRSVVVSMGFETGPASMKYLAGVSPEIDWYLKNNQNRTKLVIGRADSQRLPLGPIECEEE